MKKATLYMLALILAPAMVFAQDVNWPHTVGPEYEDYTYYMFDVEDQEVTDNYFTWQDIEEGGFLTEDGLGPWPRGKAFSQDGNTVYVGQFSFGAFPSVAQRFDYNEEEGEWEFHSNWPRGYEGDEDYYVEDDDGEDVQHPVHHTTHGMAVDADDNLWVQHHFAITDLVHGEDDEDTTGVAALYVFDDEGVEKDMSPIKTIEVDGETDTLTTVGVGLREITGGPYEGDIVAAYGTTLYVIDSETGEGLYKHQVYDENTLTSPGVDEEGNIYASNVFGGHPVYQYSPDLDSRTAYIDDASGFSRSVQVNEGGTEFYRAAYTSHAVMKYERTVPAEDFGDPEPVMRGFSAQSLDRDRDGNLWANAGDDGEPANRWLFEAPRAQLIHASADPALAEVDVYVTDEDGNHPDPAEDEPALGGVEFQNATDYLVFPEDETIGVQFTAAGEDDVAFETEVAFGEIGESIIVARGDLDDQNGETGFNLDIIDGQLESSEADEVDLEIYHAVTDAPGVDAYARDVDQLASGLGFGENTGFAGLLPDLYAVDIYGEGSNPEEDDALSSFQFDLEAEEGNALTAVATGYLDANDDNGAAEFDIMVVTAEGDVLQPRNITSSPEEDDPEVVQELSLEQNYPNPFNPATNIEFTVPETQDVTITVYDMLGREVSTLVNEQMSAGSHTVTFDASDLSSGTYIYRLEAGGEQITRQMTFVK